MLKIKRQLLVTSCLLRKGKVISYGSDFLRSELETSNLQHLKLINRT